MKNTNPGISCAFYTVKQLAALFGKSEDTIRRWKNEGVGKEEDNIKLRAIEREDALGRKNARHLVFSREAVIDFVKANPFLMDNAPQLNMMMQAEGAWNGGAIPLGGEIGEPEADDEFFPSYPKAEPEDRRPLCDNPRPQRRPIPDFDFDDDFDTEPPVPPRFRGFTPPPFDDEDDFEEEIFEEDFSRFNRSCSGRRKSSDENDEKLEMLEYVKSLLEKERREQEEELHEVSSALREMNRSSMNLRSGATVRRVIQMKEEELRKTTRYIKEFIRLLEEE